MSRSNSPNLNQTINFSDREPDAANLALQQQPEVNLNATVNFDSSVESKLNASALVRAPELSSTQQLDGQAAILADRKATSSVDDLPVRVVGNDGNAVNLANVSSRPASDVPKDLLNQTVDFSSDNSQSQAGRAAVRELDVLAESSEEGSERDLSDLPAGELDGDPAANSSMLPEPDHAAELPDNAELEALHARIRELELQQRNARVLNLEYPTRLKIIAAAQQAQAQVPVADIVADDAAPAPFVSTQQRLQQRYDRRNAIVNGIKEDELLEGREKILDWAIEDLQEILELYAEHLKMPALPDNKDLNVWIADVAATNDDNEAGQDLKAKKQAVVELYEASGVPLKTFNTNAHVRGNYTTYREYAVDRLKVFQEKVVEKTAILNKDRDAGRLVLAIFASICVVPAVVWAIGSKINRDSYNIFASHGNALSKKSTAILDDVTQQGINFAA